MPHLGCAHGGEGKGSARHRPFTSQCGSAPFVRSALPMATRGAPCKTAQRSANGEAIACHSRRSRGVAAPAKGNPLAWPLACAQQFCRARPVRAPKERQCFAHGKTLLKTCRPQGRGEKGLRGSLGLSPLREAASYGSPCGHAGARPSPKNKGRGIAAAPFVRAIGFRLWLSFSLFRGSGTLAASTLLGATAFLSIT